MHPQSFLGSELKQLPSGRVFCRTNGGTGFIGLVEMPAYISTECLRQFRFNTHVWVDAQMSRIAASRYNYDPDQPSYLGEHDAKSLLQDLEFGQPRIADGLECFVRKSFLPHGDPTMSWNIIVSAKREHLSSMLKDGLYEFKGGTCTLISEEPYNGNSLGAQFSEPLWGPSGKSALSTTMEMTAYQRWIGPEQERNMRRDPRFKDYVEAMNALGELPMYMTQAEVKARDELSHTVIRRLLNKDDDLSPSA